MMSISLATVLCTGDANMIRSLTITCSYFSSHVSTRLAWRCALIRLGQNGIKEALCLSLNGNW